MDWRLISEKVRDDKEIQKRLREQNEFYKHLSNACKSVLGEVSLKKLKQLIEPHIGGEN